jgi:hypothetical protein
MKGRNAVTASRNWWINLWEHMPAAIASMPLLTAAEQTRLTWARLIETPGEAPPAYGDSLRALAAELGCFPRCILTPSYAGFLTRTTEKLVCCYGDRIHILECVDSELRSVIYAQPAIDLMEFGSILLKAWLKIVGTDNSGQHTTTTMKFNAVTDFLVLPILAGWRSRLQRPGTASLADERAKFDPLSRDHYKFMNVARKVLLPGDRVLAYVMQPEMRAPVIELFGHTISLLKAPAHIVVLTARELIVAAEESHSGWRDDGRYGSISTYIPLHKIAGVEISAMANGCLQLTIQLPEEEEVRIDFAATHATDVDRLIELLADPLPARSPVLA